MRVTREQSAKVQEICFRNGIEWKSREKITQHLDKYYLFISNNKSISYGFCENNFNEDKFEEIDPELFIRTNGDCIENPNKDESEIDNSINNGGKTDYYQLKNAPFQINDFDDFAEWRELNGSQFNMGKVMWTFNTGRHSGTNYERDLNKIIHYANRELLRLKRGEK